MKLFDTAPSAWGVNNNGFKNASHFAMHLYGKQKPTVMHVHQRKKFSILLSIFNRKHYSPSATNLKLAWKLNFGYSSPASKWRASATLLVNTVILHSSSRPDPRRNEILFSSESTKHQTLKTKKIVEYHSNFNSHRGSRSCFNNFYFNWRIIFVQTDWKNGDWWWMEEQFLVKKS